MDFAEMTIRQLGAVLALRSEFFFIIFAVVVVAAVVIGHLAREKRRKQLTAWAAASNLSFEPGKNNQLDGRFPLFKCLRRGHSRYGYNLISGHWQGRKMWAFDYHYVTGSGKNRQTHRFSAVIVRSTVPLKGLLIRPEGLFDKITEFFGYDDLDFESAEFSRRFYVKADDRRWAYDVLHPLTIEFLLDSPTFTMQLDPIHAIAYRSGTFSPDEFAQAAGVVSGLLDRMPDHLVSQQGRARSTPAGYAGPASGGDGQVTG